MLRRRVLLAGIGFFVVVLSAAWLLSNGNPRAIARADQSEGTLVTNGHAEIAAAPDTATVVIGVSSLSNTAAEAQAGTARSMEAVYQALIKLGIPDKALQTRNFRVGVEYDYDKGRQTLRGYRVTHDLYVKVEDVATLGDVLDAAVNAGATQVREVQFGMTDATNLLRQALQLAVQDAREKAEALATGAGIQGLRIRRIRDQSGYQAPVRGEFAVKALADTGAQTRISPGEVTVSADVEVEFSF